jgi:hypothetical protein
LKGAIVSTEKGPSRRIAWSATLVAATFACSVAASPAARTVAGSWGGVGAILEAPAGEEARIELDCAHGSIAGPLAVAEDGSFDWKGTFVGERGGPTRKEDAGRDAPAARFRGTLDGDRLSIRIEGASGGTDVVLFRDRAGRLRKCR